MPYDEEAELTHYIWSHFEHLMTDFERRVGRAANAREKAAASQGEAMKRMLSVNLHGFAFYRAPLEWKPGDGERLKALLSDPATFEADSGEKKCGGFHPDYAVEWSAGDKA